MKKICLIPLDSRPVNYDWIIGLAKIANFEILTYPNQYAGFLKKGANFEQIKGFLLDNYLDMDYLILSTDAFVSGGLVQSRLANFSIEELKKNLDVLRFIKNENPNLKIYVFDTIMRTSISAIDKNTAIYYDKINKFSFYLGRYNLYHNQEDLDIANDLVKDVPKEIVDRYLLCRKKKLESNKLFLDLQLENISEYTIFLQEDSMPDGIQALDQINLKEYAKKLNLLDKIRIYNGTDEGGAILLGKICLDEYNSYPKVYLHTNNKQLLNRVMPYEDRPFIDNINHMFNVLNFTKVDNPDDADCIISIYTEEKYQGLHVEDSTEVKTHTSSEEYNNYINKLNYFIDNNYNVCFIDLLFPNGGAYSIFKDINNPLKLKGYSAWNTACNSLGTALAQISINYINEKFELKNEKLNLKFLLERFIDDCFYQGTIRQHLHEQIKDLNCNIYNLDNNLEYVTELLNKLLKDFTKKHFNVDFKCYFPWERTFEINVDVDTKDLK
jgi:hypothetical protein